jgi:hypothetical protein
VRQRALAEALAAEWGAQEEVIDPTRMPLTRLVNSAIDGVDEAEAVLGLGDSRLLVESLRQGGFRPLAGGAHRLRGPRRRPAPAHRRRVRPARNRPRQALSLHA